MSAVHRPAVTVGLTSTEIAPEIDTEGTAIATRLIQNDGSVKAYIAFGQDAVIGEGIVIPAGQSYRASRRDETFDARAVNAIASSGTVTILVTDSN